MSLFFDSVQYLPTFDGGANNTTNMGGYNTITTTTTNTPPPTPNHGIHKKKTHAKGRQTRETIVYLSPRKEGQNLRHKYCKGGLTDREYRKYLRSFDTKVERSTPTPTTALDTWESEESPNMCDDDTHIEIYGFDDAVTDASQQATTEDEAMKVISSLSLREEGRNLRHKYVKGLLSQRDTRKYMKSLNSKKRI